MIFAAGTLALAPILRTTPGPDACDALLLNSNAVANSISILYFYQSLLSASL